MTPETEFMAQFASDHEIRIPAIYWLATFPHDNAPEALTDLFDDYSLTTLIRTFPAAESALKDCFDEDDEPGSAALLAAIQSSGLLGFLVVMDTAVEEGREWWNYTTMLGYGETLHEAIHVALQRVDAYRARHWEGHEPMAGKWLANRD